MTALKLDFTITLDYEGGQQDFEKLKELSDILNVPIPFLMKKLMMDKCNELLKKNNKKQVNAKRTNTDTRRKPRKKNVSNKVS